MQFQYLKDCLLGILDVGIGEQPETFLLERSALAAHVLVFVSS